MKEITAIWSAIVVVFAILIAVVINGNKIEKERTAKRIAIHEVNKVPHVIRSTDGCDVYEFEDDSYRIHYFTRCKDRTITERTYSQNLGKGRTVEKSEEITLENLK